MYTERNRSGWAALSSISVVLAAPIAAQTLDAATIAALEAAGAAMSADQAAKTVGKGGD